MQTGITLERQLTKYSNLAVTYLNSRGLHQFYTNFINANPIIPPATTAVPPSEILYQYQSGGIFNQWQLIVNSSARLRPTLSDFAFYTFTPPNNNPPAS